MQFLKRNINLNKALEDEIMNSVKIIDLLKNQSNSQLKTIKTNTKAKEIRNHIQSSPTVRLFVVSEENTLYGTITLKDMDNLAFDQSIDDFLTAADIACLNPPYAIETKNILKALELIKKTGEEQIAVINNENIKWFVGCIHQSKITSAYNEAILKRQQHC